jgi:hypothetical protein
MDYLKTKFLLQGSRGAQGYRRIEVVLKSDQQKTWQIHVHRKSFI